MTQPHAVIAENPQKEARTANWVAFIICTALLFDGYDLVIYGTVLPGLLADPGQIGQLDVATAGLLGSWALIGVLVGSLVCGAVGDFFGRRRLMLLGIAWFSVGMLITAMTTSVQAFGAMRFVTGLARGREQEALAAAERTGVPLLEERVILEVGAAPQKSGFAAVFSRQFAVAS